MNYFTAAAMALNAIFAAKASGANVFSVDMLEGEKWWGAANFYGSEMPFTEKTVLTIPGISVRISAIKGRLLEPLKVLI